LTSPAVTSRPALTRLGWLPVAAGWLLAAPAPLIFWTIGVSPVAIAIASAVLVAGGCALIGLPAGGRIARIVLVTLILGGVGLSVGLHGITEQLVYRALGKTVTCQVTNVHKSVATVVHTDSDGRSSSNNSVSFDHTTVCPNGTYTLDRQPPYPVGTRTQVTYDPHGRVGPVFSDRRASMWKQSLIFLTAGALVILIAPFVALAAARRGPEPDLPYGPPHGRQPYSTPPYPSPSGTGGGPQRPFDGTDAYRPPPHAGGPHPAPPPQPGPGLDRQARAAVNDIRSGRRIGGVARLIQLGLQERRNRRPPGPPGPPER
jgi:hypothetical protein